MSTHKNHPYHLVEVSPWPILSAITAMSMMLGMIKWFHLYNINLLTLSSIIMLMIMIQWWRDVVRESTLQGLHTMKVTLGMRWGMILFITSEVFFFVSFFWSFYHSSLTPSIELGMMWPPLGIKPFNPMQIPLLNTMILLSSGISVTWAHHSLMENNFKQAFNGLLLTIILGVYFSMLQAYEYVESPFTMADSVYGSTFFLATGFHGLHVIIGTLFLMTCLMRHYFNHFSSIHHFGFEAAAWYWHFVDVVWLFLYISIYWWGS
uniref:Cytochrome c oxidase subunit 3 n=1 Tax=Rhagophthalmus lufengensis TaxID=398797 RepID=A4UAW1_9COLE|nr:cytochrome c oxidase subunit III [Rhagophthalmus lufengensis]ABI14544.1 cytochrome c oxidase subunit III [Rhagophthalmus lufengensis]